MRLAGNQCQGALGSKRKLLLVATAAAAAHSGALQVDSSVWWESRLEVCTTVVPRGLKRAV